MAPNGQQRTIVRYHLDLSHQVKTLRVTSSAETRNTYHVNLKAFRASSARF